ncbi:MAG: serine aminopeptidase domain-containing protein, partial [Rhodospirillaceae bacterium]
GAILVAPAVWGRETMPALYRGTLWFSAHTLPWLPVSGGDLGYWPSDDMDMMRALSGDPLMIRETRTDSVWGLTNLMDEALAASADLPGQVLLLYGLKDQIIPAPPVRRAAKRMGLAETNNAETLADKRMAIYPEGWHMLLRDKQAPVVLDDLAVWLTDKQAPLPSGADSRTEAFLSEALKSADERGEKLDPLTPWLEENNLRLRPKPPPGSED